MADEASAFDALADDTRRTVLKMLSEHGELTVSAIAERFDHIGRPAVSMQLRVLRDAGLVQERRAGKYRYYSLRVEPMTEVVTFLSDLFGASLDALAATAEEQAAQEQAKDHRNHSEDGPRWGISS